jgi:hypothetical protein
MAGRTENAGDSAMNPDDIKKAVEIVGESRQSHVSWNLYYDRRPEEEAKHADTCGDRAWQDRCIMGYDHVLKVLGDALSTANHNGGVSSAM